MLLRFRGTESATNTSLLGNPSSGFFGNIGMVFKRTVVCFQKDLDWTDVNSDMDGFLRTSWIWFFDGSRIWKVAGFCKDIMDVCFQRNWIGWFSTDLDFWIWFFDGSRIWKVAGFARTLWTFVFKGTGSVGFLRIWIFRIRFFRIWNYSGFSDMDFGSVFRIWITTIRATIRII
jgi:hypothetical protein